MLEDRCERRAGVFGIDINLAGDERIVREIAAEFVMARDHDMLRLQFLRKQLSENHALRKIFRADDDRCACLCRRACLI